MPGAVFLDRDGTINVDDGYIHDPAKLEFLPGVISGLRKLQIYYQLIMVTNQSGIGRGYYDIDQFWQFQDHLIANLSDAGVDVLATYYCPHHPDEDCECRKPKTFLFEQAAKEHKIEVEKSFFLGDKERDILPGHKMGGQSILINTEIDIASWDWQPQAQFGSLDQAADYVIKLDL